MPSGSDSFPRPALPAAIQGSDAAFALPPDDDEEGGANIGRYVAALLRYKWMIGGLALLGLGAGFGVSRLVKPVYNAQATISIDVSSRTAQASSPIRNAPLLEARAWLDLLRSFQVLDEVVRRRQLFIEPAEPSDAPLFAGLALTESYRTGSYQLSADATGSRISLLSADGTPLETAAVGDSIGAALGIKWVAPPLRPNRTLSFVLRSPRDAAVRLGNDLGASLPPENAAMMRLQLRGEDPDGIAATLNAVADRFVEFAAVLKRERLTTNSTVLRDQLASAYQDLRTAEQVLESYRVTTITLPSERGSTQLAPGLSETRDPVRNAFFQLRIDRDALVRDRDAIQRALRASADSAALLLVSLGSVPSVASASELSTSLAELSRKRAEARALSINFSAAHAPLAQLNREIEDLEQRTIPAQAGSLVASLNQRIADFDERIGASSREMQQIPTRSSELARHERNLDIAQTLYTQLRASYEQAILAERSAAADVRVLDRAVPPTTPVTDQILMIIAGGMAGGFALGIFLTLALDRFDRRLRYPDQVTRELGLTILGALPLLRTGRDGRHLADDEAHLTEALRSVRMNLMYAHGTAGTFCTTITSPGPGDGKSFTAFNLARSLAQAGHRTLLIDGDTRRGHLHKTIGVERRPGLLDFLAGVASREAIVRRGVVPGLDFISCGTRNIGGPEMLASAQMAQLVMALRSEYTAVIIDSPPLGAGVDPMVLAALSGTMVMVLRTGVTDRELAEARMQDVHRLPIRVLGAILNDVKPEGIYRYYSYLPGYRAEGEDLETSRPKRGKLLGRGGGRPVRSDS